MTERTRRARIAAAALAGWVSAPALGCSMKRIHLEPPDCIGPAAFSHLDPHLIAGTVTYPFGDRPAESWTLVAGSEPPGSGHCTAFLASTVVPSGSSSHGGGAYDDGVLTIACGDTAPWEMVIRGISPRHLGLGSFASPSPQQANPAFTPAVDSFSPRMSCVTVTPHRISLDITRASGGPVPYPRMVTADYARDFTVRFESLVDVVAPRTACSDHLPGIEIAFTESAADVVVEPDAISACE